MTSGSMRRAQLVSPFGAGAMSVLVDGTFWTEDEINQRLDRIMREAFLSLWDVKERHGVTLRTAAYIVACTRVLEARALRGLYP